MHKSQQFCCNHHKKDKVERKLESFFCKKCAYMSVVLVVGGDVGLHQCHPEGRIFLNFLGQTDNVVTVI